MITPLGTLPPTFVMGSANNLVRGNRAVSGGVPLCGNVWMQDSKGIGNRELSPATTGTACSQAALKMGFNLGECRSNVHHETGHKVSKQGIAPVIMSMSLNGWFGHQLRIENQCYFLLRFPGKYPLLPERFALPSRAPRRFEPSLTTIVLLALGRCCGYTPAGQILEGG